ncbi:MAG TPA: hypothetical protein VM933_08955 [Acidimicrobiales bacterium]|nr:hypothetical protein [Acidimicrobiales bacterium]
MAPDPEAEAEAEAQLARHADRLADAVDVVLPGWVERSVGRRLPSVSPAVRRAAEDAGRRAGAEIGGAVRALLATDVDAQRGNPLALLRRAVRYPTEVLLEAGAPAVARDEYSMERFPDDDYDLTPATWSDIDPSLQELGLTWGAAKAYVHKARHRPSGGGGT